MVIQIKSSLWSFAATSFATFASHFPQWLESIVPLPPYQSFSLEYSGDHEPVFFARAPSELSSSCMDGTWMDGWMGQPTVVGVALGPSLDRPCAPRVWEARDPPGFGLIS